MIVVSAVNYPDPDPDPVLLSDVDMYFILCMHCDINCCFTRVCRSKSHTGLMLHVI